MLGMSADQMEAAVSAALNQTEADLVWLLARREVQRAGRDVAARPQAITAAR